MDDQGKGLVQILCGKGKGKTTAAIGKAIQAASMGKTVMIIQFLKKRYSDGIGFIGRLEPEIRLFRFERSEECYDSLSEEKRKEECANIRNGLSFARKVLVTQGCNVLVLDEVLGLVAAGIISAEEIRGLLAQRGDTDVILTGVYEGEEFWEEADEVTVMRRVKPAENND